MSINYNILCYILPFLVIALPTSSQQDDDNYDDDDDEDSDQMSISQESHFQTSEIEI